MPVDLPLLLGAPEALRPKALYALEALLAPLGLRVRPVGALPSEGPALAYGPEAPPERPGLLRLTYAPAAAEAFGRRRPLGAGAWRAFDFEGEAWPAPFWVGEAPDFVASAFCWLSGWQEHAAPARDVYGRFPYAGSAQAAWDCARRPPVDACREALAAALAQAGAPLRRRRWGAAAWAFCPTHDIDYLHKWRPGTLYRELTRHLAPGGSGRLRALAAAVRRDPNPFRSALGRMAAETVARGGRGTYFFKAGAHGPHDVAYRLGPAVRARMQALAAEGFEVGLHPSFYAHTHPGYLAEERARLSRAAGAPPEAVRQHYLRWEAPATPRLQAAAGFRIDSSLGFAEHEGFRNGTCLPFRLYDLARDQPLDLWEMPLAVMEATLFNRRGLDREARRRVTAELLGRCRRFGGVCVGLWHNVLWDELDYPGWGEHFTDTLEAARDGGAHIGTLSGALRAWLED